MTLSQYAALISDPVLPLLRSDEAAEKKSAYHILTERHMQAMWLEQKYFKPLKTKCDELIEVISPGIWNSEAGPDFLKAHIKIGSREWRGDIELHLSQEGWYHHNHHTDPNYDGVILHVCYWLPIKERQIAASNGKTILQTFLQPSLTIPETRILKLIDLDLYPYKHFAGSGSCSRLLFNQLPKDKTIALFRSAAVWRLKQKYEYLKIKIDSPQNFIQGGIAMTLGYKHNSEAFLAIFNILNAQKMQGEMAILTYALGMGDFFSAHFQNKWSESTYFQQLHNEFLLYGKLHPIPATPLKLDKIRPANHPVRRLAILAKIIADRDINDLPAKLLALWKSTRNMRSKRDWKKLKESFLELIPSYHDNYWSSHYTFEKYAQSKPIALIGSDLKREILINVYLPLLYANIETHGDESERLAFANFYGSLPSSKTKKSAYLNYRFFGSRQKLTLSNADMQQGAYQIHRDFCLHFEASCQGCPFVERVKIAVI